MEETLFEIWSEGYRVTGESSPAICLGTEYANNFRDACIKHFSKEKGYFDSQNLTYWGCQLFDNEKDARKKFG